MRRTTFDDLFPSVRVSDMLVNSLSACHSSKLLFIVRNYFIYLPVGINGVIPKLFHPKAWLTARQTPRCLVANLSHL